MSSTLPAAVGRVDRQVEPVLAGESLQRLRRARVCLQRQWFVGSQHLGQERQRVTELLPRRRPQLALRVGLDHVQKGVLRPVTVQPRRITRMRAQPQFGLGMWCWTGPSSEFSNCGA
jgi:hypothetical protein